MIFASHNFSQNYKKAVKYKDKNMLSDILLSETAKIIVSQKNDLIRIIARYEDIKDNASDSTIIDAVAKLIKTGNQKFIDDLVAYIMKASNYSSAEGDKVLDPNVFTDALKEKDVKAEIKKNIETINKQLKSKNKINKNSNINVRKVLTWTFILGVGGWILYEIWKANPNKPQEQNGSTPQPDLNQPISSMGNGGNISNNNMTSNTEASSPVVNNTNI